MSNNCMFEFENNLKSQCDDDKDYFRLHYVEYHRMFELLGIYENNIGCCDYPFASFKLPRGMSKKDAYKVISYLKNYIRSDLKLIPNSLEETKYLDEVMHLDRFGFKYEDDVDNNNVNDLFIVDGRCKLFTETEDYSKYFDWEVKNVLRMEVKYIYSKLGKDFSDPVCLSDNKKDIINENENIMKIYKNIMGGKIQNRSINYAKEVYSDLATLNLYGYSINDFYNLCEEYSKEDAIKMILEKK